MKTPEGKIKDKVKALLAKHGCYRFMPVQMGFGERSLDFLVCHYGRFIAVETKRHGKELTAIQQEVKRRIEDAGGSVFRVSDDMELLDLEAALRNIEHKFTRALLPPKEFV